MHVRKLTQTCVCVCSAPWRPSTATPLLLKDIAMVIIVTIGIIIIDIIIIIIIITVAPESHLTVEAREQVQLMGREKRREGQGTTAGKDR